ncbi:hypothetical protein [Lacinutrix salivirga]
MKKFILKTVILLFILISTFSFAQIKTTYFVDDVKHKEIVTLNFCVSDSAQVTDVKIVDNKTTYQNKANTQEIISYLESIEFHAESTLKNKCHNITFEFINKKYTLADAYEKDVNKCKAFKTGNFRYQDIRFKDTKIKRGKRFQNEKNTKRDKKNPFKEKYEISWPSPCEYELKYIKVSNKNKEYLIGESIKVKIIALTGNGYVYKATLLDQPETIGVIVFDKK